MYQSIPSLNSPPRATPRQIIKNCQIPPPQFFFRIPGGSDFPGPFFLLILNFFTIFKISIINFPAEHLQIYKNNIDFVNEKYVKIVLICISYQLIFMSNGLP